MLTIIATSCLFYRVFNGVQLKESTGKQKSSMGIECHCTFTL